MKIIGCGNPHRADDSAGIVAAERLQRLGVPAEIHTGDALSLLDMWECGDEVVLIDAVVTGAPAGKVSVWENSIPPFAPERAVSSHGFDLGGAIELGRALKRLPGRLRVYGIEGKRFGRGESLSLEVEHAVELVTQRIREEVMANSEAAISHA